MNRKLQREIIDRDQVCQLCGSEKFLSVHHFNDIVQGKWVSAYVTEKPDLLITLCKECHGHLHGKGGGKVKWDYRRRLILKLFGVDVGICMIHRYALNYITKQVECLYCHKPAQKVPLARDSLSRPRGSVDLVWMEESSNLPSNLVKKNDNSR